MKFTVCRVSGENKPPYWEKQGIEKFDWVGYPVERIGAGHYWIIELGTIEDLVEFSRLNGQIIINDHSFISDDMPEIEIYDDWRE